MFHIDLQNTFFFFASLLNSLKISQGEIFSEMAAEIEETKKELLGEELEQDVHNDVLIIFQKKQHDISLKWVIEQQKKDQQLLEILIDFLPNLFDELNELIEENQKEFQIVDDQNQVDQEQFLEIPNNFENDFQNDFQNDLENDEHIIEGEIENLDDEDNINDEINDDNEGEDYNEQNQQNQQNDLIDQDFVNPVFIEQEDEEEEDNKFIDAILVFIQEIWRMLLVRQCLMLPIPQRNEIIHLLRLPIIDKELILSRLNSMIVEQNFQEPILIENFKTLHYLQELLQKTGGLINQFIEI
jgi:hypothetical protein